jgi:hypothetical protein
MPKLNEDKPCPRCAGTMTWRIERGPDPDAPPGVDPEGVPLRKLWKCDECGHEDEFSYRMNEPS